MVESSTCHFYTPLISASNHLSFISAKVILLAFQMVSISQIDSLNSVGTFIINNNKNHGCKSSNYSSIHQAIHDISSFKSYLLTLYIYIFNKCSV